MTFTVNSVTRCEGLDHYIFDITLGTGVTHRIVIHKDDLALEPDDMEISFVARVRSAVKEAGATTAAQAKAVLEGSTYKI